MLPHGVEVLLRERLCFSMVEASPIEYRGSDLSAPLTRDRQYPDAGGGCLEYVELLAEFGLGRPIAIMKCAQIADRVYGNTVRQYFPFSSYLCGWPNQLFFYIIQIHIPDT